MNILIFTFSPYHDVYEHSSVAGYIMEIQIAAYYLANAYNMLSISYYVPGNSFHSMNYLAQSIVHFLATKFVF